jgi:hypothetical protein
MMKKVLTLAFLTLGICSAAVPGGALASTVTRSGSVVTVTGGPESSNVSTHGLGFGSVMEDKAGITAGPGCTQESSTTAYCGSLDTGVVVNASMGEGNDTFNPPSNTSGAVGGVIRGGPGNDDIAGGNGNQQLYGEEGIDEVWGGEGNDLIEGGPGTDMLVGDSLYLDTAEMGSDTINSRDGEIDEVLCGLGIDTVTADAIDKWSSECEQVSTAPASGPGGSSVITLKLAKKMLPRFLKQKFHGRYTSKTFYMHRCTEWSDTKARCSVHWIHGSDYYWGYVTMWLKPTDPNIVRATIAIHGPH